MENFGKYNLCCNPLQLEDHRVKNGLRRASVTQQAAYNLSTNNYLCTSCRKALSLQSTASSPVAEINTHVEEQLEDNRTGSTLSSISNISSGLEDFSEELTAQTSSLSGLSLGTVLPMVNDAFALLNQSPIIKKHVDNQTYLEKKVKKVYEKLNTS
ncbi:uncharacterized protein LOC123273390 [Cotesia glomerata]|uniref:uncharacterized protein LOC123273390 n=1 Tax=Cotesia glomerata TaxID=32391 RepID=UPI001D01398E|nr:uncharacterized protein LOC123273390 [Cotesia glomerata]